ncbi:hypothetical protein GGI35DRAFT_156348 [Trichoderma velutinum]
MFLVQKARLVLPATKGNYAVFLSVIDIGLELLEAQPTCNATESEHCPLFQRFFSLLIPYLMGSLAFARAAHIDLALVPYIGTSIDLEISLRHCLQSKASLRKYPRVRAKRSKPTKKIKV